MLTWLLRDLYAQSKGGTDFPLMVVCINFTQVAMQALRAGALTRAANKAKGPQGLYDAFHAFHAACCLHFLTQWRRRGLSIADFGYLRKEIEQLACKKPAKLLAALQRYESKDDLKAAMGVSGKKEDVMQFGS